MKRKHISLKTKLASALLALGHIPYDDAKRMTAEQLISLYQFDHGILHALGGTDDYWNLTPKMIVEHRQKSRKDTKAVAKVKRLIHKNYSNTEILDQAQFGRVLHERPKREWPSRKIQSRPFPKKPKKRR
jgi:hypothetical protein